MAETKPRELFHQAHYNILAKEIREHFPANFIESDTALGRQQKHLNEVTRGTLADLALSLCKRFKQDNPSFDPIKFLSACSPDNDLYPLAELWEGDQLG